MTQTTSSLLWACESSLYCWSVYGRWLTGTKTHKSDEDEKQETSLSMCLASVLQVWGGIMQNVGKTHGIREIRQQKMMTAHHVLRRGVKHGFMQALTPK